MMMVGRYFAGAGLVVGSVLAQAPPAAPAADPHAAARLPAVEELRTRAPKKPPAGTALKTTPDSRVKAEAPPKVALQIAWSPVAELPAVKGQKTPGLAGVFAGALDAGHAVVAGGTFYADKGPLEGGAKSYTDAIFVLEKKPAADGASAVYSWIAQTTKLPRPLANGMSVSIDTGVLCLGGADAEACSADVFLLKWNAAQKGVELVKYPSLPKPLAFAGAARAGKWLVVAGGTNAPGAPGGAEVFAFDLSQQNHAQAQWQTFPQMTRTALFPVCAGQADGTAELFFVLSGREVSPTAKARPLTDGVRLDLARRSWSPAGPIKVTPASEPVCVMGGTAVTLEDNRILVLGGDDGSISQLLDSNARRTGPAEEREALKKFNEVLVASHPGYRREALVYNARLGQWSPAGHFPQGTPAATPAFLWDGAVVLAGGESRPGERSAKVWLGKFEGE